MILVANRITVAVEHATAFETMLETRASLVDGMPGFLGIQLLRPTKPGEPYLTQTFWAARDDFEAWLRSDAFVRGHARIHELPKGTFTSHTQVEIHEVFHTAPATRAPRLGNAADAR
ncbi:MAG: antibiotic biosynthesis monooxygenase [bacterium]